jgi:phosphonate transport system permease protein
VYRLNAKKIFWIALVFLLFIWSGWYTGVDLASFFKIGNTVDFIANSWFPLDWSVTPLALRETLVTLQMAFFSTVIALAVALPLSFLAAKNTSPSRLLYDFMRMLLNFLRSIPELVLALILIPTLGLGPVPAIMAIFIHNVGVFGKLISELIEAIDRGPQEAVASVGARKVLVSLYAVLPQIWPNVLSQYFYRFEVAIRTSLILGIVGAGGIGQMLFIDFKIFDYQKVAVEVIFIMVLVTLVDYLGSYVRNRVI